MMRTPAARPAPVVPIQTGSTATNQTASTAGKWIVMAISAAAGFFAVRLLPAELGVRIVGGMIAGTLVGLIPFAVAKSRGDTRFGQTAIGWSVLAGAVLGIVLAAPVALGFTIAAAKRSPRS
jgi:hypothetical protein